MTFDPNYISRRDLLRSMTALAGTAALAPLGIRRACAEVPDLPPNFGRGRTVAIIGAGVRTHRGSKADLGRRKHR